jgi:hypothetical protein
MKKLYLIINLLVVTVCYSQKIKVTGNWNKKLKTSEISEAGNDYNPFYISKINQSKITITAHPKSKYFDLYGRFKVFVHKEDDEWNPTLILQLKRTSNGSKGNYNISSGMVFQTITNNSSFFFSSVGKQVKVPIQYKIIGISVLLPVKKYSTQIVYTVMNL